MTKKNYILIDYENVQPNDMTTLNHAHFHVFVFVGANQTKINFEMVSALQKLGERATYIKISGNGNNSLDFHVAYYIGKLASEDPSGYFHIISKDTGFDPLITHLKSKKIYAFRLESIIEMPSITILNSNTIPEKAAAVMTNLKQRDSSKPKKIKTLGSTISALFQKTLSEQEVKSIIDYLLSQGIITLNEDKISYAQQYLEAQPIQKP